MITQPDQPSTTDSTTDATGHVAAAHQVRGRTRDRTPAPAASSARISRRYPGRDRLDAASSQLRRGFAALSREADVLDTADGQLAAELERLVDDVAGHMMRVAAAADAAVMRGPRHQTVLRRHVAKLEQLARSARTDSARAVIASQLEQIKGMLIEPPAAP